MVFAQTSFILQLVSFRMTKVHAHCMCIQFIFNAPRRPSINDITLADR